MTIATCLMHTPFGSPVVPDVYMMKASSSPLGGAGARGAFTPSSVSFLRSVSLHVSLNLLLTASLMSPHSGSGWICTTNLTVGQFFITLATASSLLWSQKITLSSACLASYSTMLSPSVSYTGTHVRPREKPPSAMSAHSIELAA